MLRTSRRLLMTCSLIVWGLGCSHMQAGPHIDVCPSDPAMQGFDCAGKEKGKHHFIPYAESRDIIGIPSKDLAELINYCRAK